jgi:hypothetical protein
VRERLRRALAVLPLGLALASCASSSVIGMESMMRPTPAPASPAPAPAPAPGTQAPPNRLDLSGRFVKLTGFPCHRSDPYVGNETVVFLGSDGSRTTIVTGSANWIGLGATRSAPLGQCRQVAPFEAELPVAGRYVVLINDRRLAPVTLATLRGEGFRHTFRLPS